MALGYGEAVGIGLGLDEALESLGIGILGNGQGFAGSLYDGLTLVEFSNGQGYIEFGISGYFLFGTLSSLHCAASQAFLRFPQSFRGMESVMVALSCESRWR